MSDFTRCSCGGEAISETDFDGYFICCMECNKATRTHLNEDDAVEEWETKKANN